MILFILHSCFSIFNKENNKIQKNNKSGHGAAARLVESDKISPPPCLVIPNMLSRARTQADMKAMFDNVWNGE